MTAGRVRIAASLWSVAPADQDEEAARLSVAGVRVWHWDRSDGSMAAAGGFDVSTARRLTTATGLASEAHLMLQHPLTELDHWTAFCDRVVVHVESSRWRQAVDRVRASGAQAAVALSPGTDPTDLELPGDIPVLVMSVEPGQGGAVFQPASIERIRTLAQIRGVDVGVDGGLTGERARECVSAGARWIVSGTGLLGAHDPASWMRHVEGCPVTGPASPPAMTDRPDRAPESVPRWRGRR